MTPRGSILNPDEEANGAASEPATNPWWPWLKGRSKIWWTSVVVTFVLIVFMITFIEERYNVRIRFYGPLLLLLGGIVGDWISSHIQSVREQWAYDPYRAARLRRRVMLIVGVLLFVVNILPEYRENSFTSGGGYYWSTLNSLLAGVGAILVLLAFAAKRNGDSF